MNEYNDVLHEMPDCVQQRRPEQSADQFSNVANRAADNELQTELEALPFTDENQKKAFFKNVQRLHGIHFLQLFKLGVIPLQKSTTEPSQLIEKVMKLFDICLSYCYTADMSKRVAFEYYARALKFCFPSQPKQCLSTAVVSRLLEVVQIFQEGKLASIVEKTEQLANSVIQINGAKHFFDELLAIFETRRDDGYIAEIVDQTKRFASADASVSCINDHVVGNVSLRSDHVVSPVLLTNWMKLLKLGNVSSGFACALAKLDTLHCKKQFVPLFHPSLFCFERRDYQSIVWFFVEILEEMNSSGSEVSLPTDEERLGIFFKHINHFCQHRNLRTTSLKLLATTSITNEVLREALDLFFTEEKRPIQHSLEIKVEAFDHLFKILSLLPDGKLVNKLLKFWSETFSVDPDYQHCACLLALIVEVSSSEDGCDLQEKAERTLDFLYWLPSNLLPFLAFWYPFLASFIRLFPTSFQNRPEVLIFIHKAVLAARVPAEMREAYVTLEQLPPCRFLNWVSQQSFPEEVKDEMISLLLCCTDGGSLVQNWNFSINVTKQLSLCQELSFSTKKVVLRDFTRFAKLFKEQEKMVFRECVENVASNQTLELKDEIFSEILKFVNRFADKERPMKTIPSNVLQLLSLVSQIPVSGDRRVKLMQMSKESGKGLENGLRILNLMKLNRLGDLGEINRHFDLLFSVFVDILKGQNALCEQFCKQARRYWSSSQAQEVWSFEVAKLISLGSFKEEIDCQCCYHVLNAASELSSSEMLQLFSQVRESAEKVICVLRYGNDIHSLLDGSDNVPQTFVSSLAVVVSSNVLSGTEKLLLVKKVCDVFVNCPESLTELTVENALNNLIPFSLLRDSNSLSNKDVLRLELNEIEAILENPTMMAQLSRLPVQTDNSLCSVFSTKASNYFSRGQLVDIYYFIGSQEHLDKVFFSNIVPILEIAIQGSSAVEGVVEIVQELVGVVCAVPPERIPFIMENFGYLLGHQVAKQEREKFLSEVAMKWDFSPNSRTLSYLEVPRLLWNVYTTTNTSSKRCQLIVRLEEILKKTKSLESVCAMDYAFPVLNHRDSIRRRISCCELEWLVLHSSLSTDEAALAYDLSFCSFKQPLRCFNFSDVQIDEGCFKFAPQETSSEATDNIPTTISTIGNAGSDFPATEPQVSAILTPVLIAQKMIHRLKCVLRQGEDLTEIAFSLWNVAFNSRSLFGCEAECAESLSFLDDYVDVFLSILAEASSTEIMLHWASVDSHHVHQCSEVVLKACKWSSGTEDIGKEAMLKFQAAVSTTLETIRKKTPLALDKFAPLPFMGFSVPCFRLLKPQLEHLGNMLESRLPIDVTTQVLNLFQANVQAGATVADIVSSWSSRDQKMELVERVHACCQEEEILSMNPAHSEFVWQLLSAFSRYCMNSCKDLMVKLKELIILYDPEDEHGFNRLPKWREVMIADGFSPHVINCWCVAFLMTPLEDLSSRDVDAIADLNSRSLQLVAPLSQRIKNCIFPEGGFQETQGEGIKEPSIKKRLRLARLLGEFINILKLRKPEENRKDAAIKTIVVEACNELCEAHENQNRRRNDLYKIHGQMLKALFTEVFGKRRKLDDDEDCAVKARQTVVGESRGELPVARQSSYLHDSLPSVLSHKEVYEPLLVLLRRWLSQIVVKPTLASHTLKIVQLLFSAHSSKEIKPEDDDPHTDFMEKLHRIINAEVLSLEENQVLIAQLQASGYNQNTQGTLWSSSKLECFGYLSKSESSDSRRFKKKLERVLRPLWNEWKNILFMHGIASIKVGETDVCTKDLFSVQASLEEMEKQVFAVKEILIQNKSRSEDLERRIKRLMRLELQHRGRIDKLYKGTKVRTGHHQCFFFLFFHQI